MAIYGTARFSVKPEALDPCRSVIEEFVAYVRANEPGTKLYLSLEDAEEPTRFLHVMIFEDEGGFRVQRVREPLHGIRVGVKVLGWRA